MPYHHDFSGVMDHKIGSDGLSEADLDLALAHNALKRLRTLGETNALPLLTLPQERGDLPLSQTAAHFLTQGRDHLLILGTGGSSLGAQVLCQLNGWRVPGVPLVSCQQKPIGIHFFDNLDPLTLDNLWQGDQIGGLDWSKTSVLVVSKSGGTPETLVQALSAIDAFKRRNLDLSRHIAVLTEEGDPVANPLLGLARHHTLLHLPHHPKIGGRYSILSNVGMVPALCVGMNPITVREGAQAVLDLLWSQDHVQDIPWALGAALVQALQKKRGLNGVIMMPYSDRLRSFSHWFSQLWAESLGKGGMGTQPIAAAGPVDQHSQMQLFLDGPRDKLLTLIWVDTQGQGPRMPQDLTPFPALSYLCGRTAGDLTAAQVHALVETFQKNNRPLRAFKLKHVDEHSLGGLLMHFMLETIVLGFMMGIDPFDQPAVEQGKVLTRSYLQSFARASSP